MRFQNRYGINWTTIDSARLWNSQIAFIIVRHSYVKFWAQQTWHTSNILGRRVRVNVPANRVSLKHIPAVTFKVHSYQPFVRVVRNNSRIQSYRHSETPLLNIRVRVTVCGMRNPGVKGNPRESSLYQGEREVSLWLRTDGYLVEYIRHLTRIDYCSK